MHLFVIISKNGELCSTSGVKYRLDNVREIIRDSAAFVSPPVDLGCGAFLRLCKPHSNGRPSQDVKSGTRDVGGSLLNEAEPL